MSGSVLLDLVYHRILMFLLQGFLGTPSTGEIGQPNYMS